MTKQGLIFDKPVPVSKARHGKWQVQQGQNYDFAKGLNAVPLATVEFAIAAREYPIVFTKTGEKFVASALLGLRDGENLFVSDEGKWEGKYVPAFLRRYPFVFSHNEDAGTYTLCIDEGAEIAGEGNDGERLFTDEGDDTKYLQGVMAFNTNWQRAFQETEAFCERLSALDLIVDSEISFKLPDGQSARTRGFAAVDRDRLKGLGKGQLMDLFQGGDLERIYAHLLSHRSLDDLLNDLPREFHTLN